jgi:hypothetical protein
MHPLDTTVFAAFTQKIEWADTQPVLPLFNPHTSDHAALSAMAGLENQGRVRRHILTSINITGTSISTPTTVANAAPEDKPNNIVAVAMATSKWFDAPIIAVGAASS